MGDSVLWGQGLMPGPENRCPGQPGCSKEAKNLLTSDVGVYVTNRAHSGAVIGIGEDDVEDTKRPPALDPKTGLPQEVNTDYPTILQQVADFNDQPETIDLILVDGGINDVNVHVVLRTLDPNNLIDLIDSHCRRHMSVLLDRITQKFPKAKVIVTGYFPIISDASDVGRLTPYLLGLDLLDGVKQALGVTTIDEAVQLKLAANCAVFYEHSEMALQRAVDGTNAKLIQAGSTS